MEGINVYIGIFTVIMLITVIFMGLALINMRVHIKNQRTHGILMGELLDEYRCIKHKYSNYLQRMVCFIDELEWQGLIELKGELGQLKNARIQYLSSLLKIKSARLIDTVMSFKASAEARNIKFHLNVCESITLTPFNVRKACKGLKNAAEMAVAYIISEGLKDIFVKILQEDKNTVILIEAGKDFACSINLK